MNILLFLYLFSTFAFLTIGLLAYQMDRQNKTNKVFLWNCFALAWWAFMYSLMVSAPSSQLAALYRSISSFAWCILYCCLLHFVFMVSKNYRFIDKWWKVYLLYMPGIICSFVYLVSPNTKENFVPSKSGLGWVYISNAKSSSVIFDRCFDTYCFIYLLFTILVLYNWRKNTKIKREKKQATVILGSMSIIALLGFCTDLILPQIQFAVLPPVSVILTTVPMATIFFAMNRYNFLNLSPQNLALEFVSIMNEGLIVLNEEYQILQINRGALEMLQYSEAEIKGNVITKILPDIGNLKHIATQYSIKTCLKNKQNQSIPVLLSYSILYDKFGDRNGVVMIFQDISEINKIQEDLEEKVSELEKANIALNNEIIMRKEAERRIAALAYYDPLTGLPNRRYLSEKVNQIKMSKDKNQSYAILSLDLDKFKNINDTLGHQAGDELLKKVAERLLTLDSEVNTVARMGGDEFLVLSQNVSDRKYLEAIAKQIIAMIHEPFFIFGQQINITTSVGISTYPDAGEEIAEVIKSADIALYKAKEMGKNKYVICTPSLKSQIVEERNLTEQLNYALERKEFEILYQPEINTATNSIIGFEALLRWNHPTLGQIEPSKFLQIAEKTGQIIQIGEWVLYTACKQNKIWQDNGLITVPVSVNLSEKQLLKKDFVAQVNHILEEIGLEPRYLVLEIKQSAIMKENTFILETLEKIKNSDINISIDDFGKKYTSFAYLKALPIDRIKIAREFLNHMDHLDASIIQSIVKYLHILDFDVMATGAETEKQIDFLKRVNCHEIQGYYYYKPMTVSEIEKMLVRANKRQRIS
jgi:diguanylate cyclase (GGDEF)-like protein/PAS domain S-box-containing protein